MNQLLQKSSFFTALVLLLSQSIFSQTIQKLYINEFMAANTGSFFDYDFGDEACMTPLLKMYTLGHEFIPPSIHAGGLRYHGAAPTISHLYNLGFIDASAYNQNDVFDAAKTFAQTEGIVPAPESSHAIKEAIEQAIKCKVEGKTKNILFNLSGHGLLDLGAYEMYLNNKL